MCQEFGWMRGVASTGADELVTELIYYARQHNY